MANLMNDERTIDAIWCGSQQDWGYCVSDKRTATTSIDLEHVPGQGALVPWFTVREGTRTVCRVNAAFVSEVRYANRA